MWKNYLKVALRSLRRHPIYSGINVMGLTLSMAVGLLIVTFIWHQFQYDQFHEHKDRIVRLISERYGNRPATLAAAPGPMGPLLEETVPQVEQAVRLSRLTGHLTRARRAFRVEGLFAEGDFFDMFDFELAEGNPRTALTAPHSLVLTEEMAAKLFGDGQAVGKDVTVEGYHAGSDTSGVFTVTGVLDEPRGPSHLTFEALASFSTLQTLERERRDLEAWDLLSKYPTYVLLQEGASGTRLTDTFSSITDNHYPAGTLHPEDVSFRTQALTSINPGPFYGSHVEFEMVPWIVVYSLAGLGAVLLLVACFNFVGLSIARSLERSTEIGVRKTVGAQRWQLASQFMAEAVLFALIALIGSYALLGYLVPLFNNLQFVGELNWHITSSLYEPAFLAICILFGIVVGLLAGCYPALHLAAFQPIRALRGTASSDKRNLDKQSFRRILTVTQLTLALIFIVTSVQLYRQYDYMANSSFGMETDHVVNVSLQGESYETLRNELLQYPSIEKISAAGRLPPVGWTNTARITSARRADTVSAWMNAIDPHFIDNMGLHLVAGSNVSSTLGPSAERSVILNQTAVRALGYEDERDAVGAMIALDNVQPHAVRVIGIVQDFPFERFTDPLRPLVLRYAPNQFWYLNVRARPAQHQAAIAAVEKTWKTLSSPYPVEYAWFETQIARDRMTLFFHDLARVVGFIAVLIIAVACLGLLGMVTYATQTRIKEVSIRKVVGASTTDVLKLLSREFLVLVSTAIVIALPLAWYANALWLHEFARRIAFNGWVMGGSVAAVLLLTLITVGSQTVSAALTNPADNLRYE